MVVALIASAAATRGNRDDFESTDSSIKAQYKGVCAGNGALATSNRFTPPTSGSTGGDTEKS
jgi:hypothetical protein